LSGEIEQAAKAGNADDPSVKKAREASTTLKDELKGMEPELGELKEKQDKLLAELPNLPEPDAPDGMTEQDAKVLREIGERPSFALDPIGRLDLGQKHGWMEMEAAASTSGSRFAYLMGDLVMLELALVRFALDVVQEEGFRPATPPVLVREPALYGTGFFPG